MFERMSLPRRTEESLPSEYLGISQELKTKSRELVGSDSVAACGHRPYSRFIEILLLGKIFFRYKKNKSKEKVEFERNGVLEAHRRNCIRCKEHVNSKAPFRRRPYLIQPISCKDKVLAGHLNGSHCLRGKIEKSIKMSRGDYGEDILRQLLWDGKHMARATSLEKSRCFTQVCSEDFDMTCNRSLLGPKATTMPDKVCLLGSSQIQ